MINCENVTERKGAKSAAAAEKSSAGEDTC